MADKTIRVRIKRHVQGEQIDPATNDKEIHTKGSVVELPFMFGSELVGSEAAEPVESDEKLVKVPLHPDKSEKK